MSSESPPARRRSTITFAANNGDIGGGEVMLLEMAAAASDAGHAVRVVGPSANGGVVERARALGFYGTSLAASRRHYLRELRAWDRERTGLLWCNGLVPAFATSGHRSRVVHLHRMPEGLQRGAARLARLGALAVVVPSSFMATALRARSMANWCPEVRVDLPRPTLPGEGDPTTARFGFLGRLGADKGVDLLADAVTQLASDGLDVRLVLAGEPLFVDDASVHVVDHALARAGAHIDRLGWVSPSTLLGQVDALVTPSVWSEPFGLVVIEAMSAGIPCIVSDAGALPEVVGPGHPWVVRAGDPLNLVEGLRSFLETPSTERARVAADARERWRTEFSPAVGRGRFLALLEELDVRGRT